MMKKMSLALALSSALLIAPFGWAQSISATTQDPIYQLDDKLVLGRVESVYYSEIPELSDVPFIGKIDTGADTTSMHAENIHVSSSNPQYKNLKDDKLLWAIVDDLGGTQAKWEANSFEPYQVTVSFTIQHPYTGKEITVTDDLERISAIRSRTSKKTDFASNRKNADDDCWAYGRYRGESYLAQTVLCANPDWQNLPR